MNDKERKFLEEAGLLFPKPNLPRPVPKYHECLHIVARLDRDQIDYFEDKGFDYLQKSIEWMSRDLLDAMLGKIEFGKDYAIRGETRQEEDIPRNQIIIRQEMQIDELVKCKDCEFYTAEEHWCRRLGLCGAFDPNDYCSHGERRKDD